jgi:hypothetical protein
VFTCAKITGFNWGNSVKVKSKSTDKFHNWRQIDGLVYQLMLNRGFCSSDTRISGIYVNLSSFIIINFIILGN